MRRVRVEKLFGLYTYTIPGPNADIEQLCVLYGDNGCGKTTVLRMIRHVLSPAHDRGHRTALTKIAFKRFEVELANGTSVVAERSAAEPGAYTLSVGSGNDIASCEFPTPDNHEQTPEEQALYGRLRSLKLSILYIPDSRRIDTSDWFKDSELRFGERMHTMRARKQLDAGHGSHREHEVLDIALTVAIFRASSWIQMQVHQGSAIGSVEANTIYTEIARKLGEDAESTPRRSEMSRLEAAIEELVTRNKELTRLGLSPNLKLGELLNAINTVNKRQRSLLGTILDPYVTGVQARFGALEDIQKVLGVFVDNLNRFFVNKRVSFDLATGLTITSQKGRLRPASLSSGERHLLLILCSALCARDEASIFIVDEPEISLNVKWQRMFLDALLDCVRGSDAQLLLASHSIELITPYRNHVSLLRTEEG